MLGIHELRAEIDGLKNEVEVCRNEITDLIKQSQQVVANAYAAERMIDDKVSQLVISSERIQRKLQYTNFELENLSSGQKDGKNILLVGYYGATNLGDELMLETICSSFMHNGRANITVLLDDNDQLDVPYYKEYSYIHLPITVHELVMMESRFDMVLIGGGAVLEDTNYELKDGRYSLGRFVVDICIRFIQAKKPALIYAVSAANDITNNEYINKLAYVVKNAEYFSCRDPYSIDFLRKIGIDTENIRLVEDVVLANSKLEKFTKKQQNKSGKKEIGVVFIYNDSQLKNLSILKDFLVYLMKILDDHFETKYKLKLIPFFTHDKYDEMCCRNIISEYGDEKFEYVDMKQDYEAFLHVCENLDYAISMRYHATLLFNVLGIPTLDIMWDTHHHYEFKVNYIYQKYSKERYELKFSDLINKKYDLTQIEEWLKGKEISVKGNIIGEAQDQLNILGKNINKLLN